MAERARAKTTTPPKRKAQAVVVVDKPKLEELECGAPDCDVRFTPDRATQKFHSATCRQRANRAKKAAEDFAEQESKTGDAEHGLVAAVRKQLEKAGALDTVDGQVALQLARRAANPQEPGLVNLTKEIRAVLNDAIGSSPNPGGASGDTDGNSGADEDEDEVTRARRQREEARKAAGLT